jgi:hypothetical protein
MRRGDEADHSPSEVKNAWSYTFTPPHTFTEWFLIKNRDNFKFAFYFYC